GETRPIGTMQGASELESRGVRSARGIKRLEHTINGVFVFLTIVAQRQIPEAVADIVAQPRTPGAFGELRIQVTVERQRKPVSHAERAPPVETRLGGTMRDIPVVFLINHQRSTPAPGPTRLAQDHRTTLRRAGSQI